MTVGELYDMFLIESCIDTRSPVTVMVRLPHAPQHCLYHGLEDAEDHHNH